MILVILLKGLHHESKLGAGKVRYVLDVERYSLRISGSLPVPLRASSRRAVVSKTEEENRKEARELMARVYYECKGDSHEMSLHERAEDLLPPNLDWRRKDLIEECIAMWTKEVHAACHLGDLPTVKRLWHPWAVKMNAVLPVQVMLAADGWI